MNLNPHHIKKKIFRFQRIGILFFMLLIFGSVSFGQTLKEMNAKALEYFKAREYAIAIIAGEEVFKLVKEKYPPEHLNYIICLDNLAKYYSGAQQYEKSAELYEEERKILETNPAKEKMYGDCLTKLGLTYKRMGLYDKALSVYKEALTYTEKTLGKSDKEYATILNNTGRAF